LLQRIAQSCYGLCFYVWKSLWPVDLSAVYILESDLDPTRAIYVASMIAVAVASIACFALRRRAVGIVTALFCYATIVSPVLGLLQSGAQKVADRYTYLSCIPFALLYGAFALRASRARAWVAFAAWLPIPLLAVLAWKQTQLWANSEALFRRAVEVEPDNYMAQHDLAGQIRLRGDRSPTDERIRLYQEAIDHELASIRAHPQKGNGGARHDLGAIYNMLGKVDEAILSWQECLTIEPDTQAVVEELQRIYAQRLTAEGRKAYIEDWIKKSPNSVAAHDFYAQFWMQQKERAKAQDAWRKTLELDPNWEPGMLGLGTIFLGAGKHADAEAQLRNAIAHNAGDLEAWNLLGKALRAQNKVDEAEACWTHVLMYNPNHAGAAENLKRSQGDSRTGK
jgi:tetratricopeptide (TPR) repeat protein